MEWKPIETAPHDWSLVLLWDGSDVTVGKFLNCDDIEWIDVLNGFEVLPTHWMPMPEPPKGV